MAIIDDSHPRDRGRVEQQKTQTAGNHRQRQPQQPPSEAAAIPEHPGAEAQAEVKKRIADLPKIQSAAARLDEAELLMGLPEMDKSPDMKQLVSAWFGAKAEVARAKTDPVEKHESLLELISDNRAKQVASAEIQKINTELTELRKQPAVKAEWDAWQMYDKIVKFEESAGKNKARLKEAQMGYDACAKQFANTRCGKKAAEAAARLSGVK